MTVSSILEHLQHFAPQELAQDWDNVGLLIGDESRRVSSVLISLDATCNAVEYAIDRGHDLILSHHPLIFRPLKSITNPVILRMIEAQIALISMHTNFDAVPGGVNHALAEELDLEVQRHLGDIDAKDIGLICSYKSPKSLKEIAELVKGKLSAERIKLWTAGMDQDQEIRRIAICGGAGASALTLAEKHADLLITGDISYHSFLDSKIPIIDAGHFCTEYPALGKLQESLQPTGLKTEILPRERHEWSQSIRYI